MIETITFETFYEVKPDQGIDLDWGEGKRGGDPANISFF